MRGFLNLRVYDLRIMLVILLGNRITNRTLTVALTVEQHLRHGVLGVVGARVLLVVLGEVLDGDRARDITARVTTHAVGHDEQVGSDEPGVLVVASDLADVGHGAGARDDQHAYRSSNVVVPMRTGVPTGTWVGWETRLPLTYVPFVESRSCTIQASFQRRRRAWWVEL